MVSNYGRRMVPLSRYNGLVPVGMGYIASRVGYELGKHAVRKAGDYVVAKGRAALNRWVQRKPPAPGSQQKPAATQSVIRRLGPGSGVLRGFIKARWGARRRGRRLRKIAKRIFKGVSFQTEAANTLTGDKCLFLGHTTACPEEMLLVLVMGCIKNVMIEAGITINSWPQLRAGYLANGDVFQFVYKPTPVVIPTAVGTTYTVIAADLSFYDVALKVAAAVKASFVAGTLSDALVLTEFQYVPVGGKLIKVDIMDSIVNIFVKSAMKVQNRSVVAPGDDEIDVNNVPVYGKLYSGWGNGMIQRTVDQVLFICGASTANPIATDTSGIPNFAEPPDASEFTHCSRYNKAYFNPGNIKTSILKFKTKINITKLFIKLMHYYGGNASSEWFDLGKFNCYGIERVIAKLAGEPSPAMNLVYELDNKFYCTISPSPQKFTAPMRIVF